MSRKPRILNFIDRSNKKLKPKDTYLSIVACHWSLALKNLFLYDFRSRTGEENI
jgi:hypothetical protein